MKKADPGMSLKQLIQEKEIEQREAGKLLKDQLHLTFESLKPMNIIKSRLKEMVSSPGLKTDLVNASMGVTAGLIAKKILTRKSHNPFIKLSGALLEMIIANKVSKNADVIKMIGSTVLKKIMHKHETA